MKYRLIYFALVSILFTGVQSFAAVSLTAKAISPTEIDLSWPAGSGKIKSYLLFRNGTRIAVLSASQLSYKDTGLSSSQSYTYRIEAVSVPVSVKTPTAPTPSPSPSTTPAPAPAPSPSTGSFPNASNAGYSPTGTALGPAQGDLSIDSPGVYSGLNVNGMLIINASNVTIENSRITATASGDWTAIYVSQGLSNVVIQDTEVIGGGVASGIVGQAGISIEGGGGGVKVLRCDIHEIGTGVSIIDGPVLVQDTYIHDFNGDPATHFNGIMDNGSSTPIDIEHNTILNQRIQTDAIMIDNDFSGVSNVTVNNNLLGGGSYVIYVSGQFSGGPVDFSTIHITNNRLQPGYYGYSAIDNLSCATGNVVDSTGAPAPLN